MYGGRGGQFEFLEEMLWALTIFLLIGFSISGNRVDLGFSEFEGGLTLFLRKFSGMQMMDGFSGSPLFGKKARHCGAFSELTKLEVQSTLSKEEINF